MGTPSVSPSSGTALITMPTTTSTDSLPLFPAVRDTVTLSNTPPIVKEPNWFIRLASKLFDALPKGVQSKLGYVGRNLSAVADMVPGFKGMSGWMKAPLLIDFGLGLMTMGSDARKGFVDSQSGFFGKLTDGIWSGVKSLGKSIGVLFSSSLATVAIPAALKLTGGWGIVAGIAAGIGSSLLSRGLLDHVLPTHNHVNTTPTGDDLLAPGFVPSSGSQIAEKVQQEWNRRSFMDPNAFNPCMTGTDWGWSQNGP